MTKNRQVHIMLQKGAVAIAVSVWLIKGLEIAGRHYGLLPRNLGWGYVVTLDLPVAVTIAVCLLILMLRILYRPKPSLR